MATNPIQQIAPLPTLNPADIPGALTAIYMKVQELIAYANGLGQFVSTLQAQGSGAYLTLQEPSVWVPTVPVDPSSKGQAE